MRIVSLVFIILLSGCASMSKEECTNIDWYELGLADAQQSHLPASMASYEKACLRHGVLANRDDYERGKRKALIKTSKKVQ